MKNLKTLLLLSSMAALSACSSGGGGGSQPTTIRACSSMELSAFNDIHESLGDNRQLSRACSSFFRANVDKNDCMAVSNVAIRTRDRVIQPGERVSVSLSEVRQMCQRGSGQNGGGGPVLPRENRGSCSDDFRHAFRAAVHNTSFQTCEQFKRRFPRDYGCWAGGQVYEAQSVYDYCRRKLR